MKRKSLCSSLIIFFFLLFLQQGGAVTPFKYHFPPVQSDFDRLASNLDSLDLHHQLGEAQTPVLLQLDSIANVHKLPILQARYLYWEVKCHQYTMSSDTCIVRLEAALKQIGNEKSYDRSRIAYQLAGNYQRINRQTEAWQLLHNDVVPGYTAAEDSVGLGNAYHLFALIYRDIGDQESANDAISRSQHCYEEADYPLNKVYFFKAIQHEGDSAAYFFRRAIAEDTTDMTIVSQAYTDLANLALEKNDQDSARYWVNCGLRAIDRYQQENQLLRAFLLVNDALLDNADHNYKKAIVTLQEVEKLCGEFMSNANSAPIYRIISDTYEHLGNKSLALEYLQRYIQANDNQRHQTEEANLQRLKAREDIHAEQQVEMDRLKCEAQSQRQRTLGITAILLLTLVAVCFLVAHYIRRRKQHEAESRQHAAESRELHEMLQQGTVEALITSNITDEADRAKAIERFEQIRPGFFAKLKAINPNLTENDLRICTYVSIGMKAKEIATQLSVTPDSVTTARYRLRKKLNLKTEEKLDDFLRAL